MIVDNVNEMDRQKAILTGRIQDNGEERKLDVSDMLAAIEWQARAQSLYDMWVSALSNGAKLRSMRDKTDIMNVRQYPGGKPPEEVFGMLAARMMGHLGELGILECKGHDDMMSIAVVATRSEDDTQWGHDLADFAASFLSACGRDTANVHMGVEKVLGRSLSNSECFFLFDHIERDRARPDREQVSYLAKIFTRHKFAESADRRGVGKGRHGETEA